MHCSRSQFSVNSQSGGLTTKISRWALTIEVEAKIITLAAQVLARASTVLYNVRKAVHKLRHA